MDRTVNLTEARNQLSALVKEVAERNDQVVITTRNEPKAIILGYQAFQRGQRLRAQGAQQLMTQLVQEVQSLIQATQESCRAAGDPALYLFLVNFEQIMHNIWETAEEISPAHAALASELLDISRIQLAGDAQLQPAQLEPLAETVSLLVHDQLTMADAAEADRYLLTHGLNALFPVHGELAPLYENDATPVSEQP